MSSSRDHARLRHGLHPLSTAPVSHFQGATHQSQQLNTPISAVSMASSNLASAHDPGSGVQRYNPQEWMPSPAVAVEVAQQHPAAEPLSSPPPPPPYSPPRSQQRHSGHASYDLRPTSTSTPPPRHSTGGNVRPSPEAQATTSFPPPPGSRGNSRERRFGLSSLTRRRDQDHVPHANVSQVPPSVRQSMGPLAFHGVDIDRMASGSSAFFQPGPPAARRAASAGAVETPTSARSRSESQTRWEPGMPIPPPPPGPPPASVSTPRSQSVQPMDRSVVPIIALPTRRRPLGVSSLGPVPPTPADWVDTDNGAPQADRRQSPGLTIDVDKAQNSEDIQDPMPSSSSLSRAGAVRHDKTIVQRRAESKTRRESRGSVDESRRSNRISDILIPSNSKELATRLDKSKSTPRSGGQPASNTPHTGESSGHQDSRNSTPRAIGSAKLPQLDTATPPFSPYIVKTGNPRVTSHKPSAMAKSLPTPPANSQSASSSRPGDGSRPPSTIPTPVTKELVKAQTADQFAAATIERYQAFATKEASAATDVERVRMFADFMVTESRIRRERYSAAIGTLGSEIFDLTRDLFRPMGASRRESVISQDWTPSSSEADRSRRGSMGSSFRADGQSSSAPTSANVPTSPSGPSSANNNWTTNFMPSLSPILSMSVSDRLDDRSSRGRTPSRWWEADSQGDPARGFQRSKRESKYMGVPKDQWIESEEDTGPYGPSNEYGNTSEYPPEKVGWHEPSGVQWDASQTGQTSFTSAPSPAPSSQNGTDVSRLVTMPPPYPRHHPAVNNSHPLLLSTRSSVRALSDLDQVDSVKEKFTIASSKRREQFSKAISEERQALRANLHKEVSNGNINYTDAAAIESQTLEDENVKKKELEKSEYELFQTDVIMPLNDLVTTRIAQATDIFDDLARHLFDDGGIDPDMPQEEGDDKPELLEKLTLLKWIFEAREALHRAIYDILSDRNSRYCEVVLTPYRLSGNTEKLKSAEAFFAEDAARREHAFRKEALERSRGFLSVIRQAVDHGVTLQVSAFWDIAPPLRELLDSIPSELEGFTIQIPASEFEESPAYHEHPLQYMFSLLLHAEKSTYQFIESHTNLLCLLHEVKEAVVLATAKSIATQLEEADGTALCEEEREERARRLRHDEGQKLTEELKEKVRVVQEQWNSALGESLTGVKERTGEWLLRTGGWDESLEDESFLGVQ